MKRQLPHFEPPPHLWTKIEARMASYAAERMQPVLGWSLTITVAALLVLSLSRLQDGVQYESSPYPSYNTLYHE